MFTLHSVEVSPESKYLTFLWFAIAWAILYHNYLIWYIWYICILHKPTTNFWWQGVWVKYMLYIQPYSLGYNSVLVVKLAAWGYFLNVLLKGHELYYDTMYGIVCVAFGGFPQLLYIHLKATHYR